MDTAERLRRQVDHSGECFVWTGSTNRDGYGRTFVNGRRWFVHRLSWVLHRGPIPDDAIVMHTCDNPSCVRIEHLRVATQAENLRDRDRKGRGKVPVRRGGRWTGAVKSISALLLLALAGCGEELSPARQTPTYRASCIAPTGEADHEIVLRFASKAPLPPCSTWCAWGCGWHEAAGTRGISMQAWEVRPPTPLDGSVADHCEDEREAIRFALQYRRAWIATPADARLHVARWQRECKGEIGIHPDAVGGDSLAEECLDERARIAHLAIEGGRPDWLTPELVEEHEERCGEVLGLEDRP